ncbi:MAG: cysteine hydrolase [Alphaproteobacteria bacterium]|nr:cysteine hydrolase [Alphaproteobacteria bacterium]
MHNITIRQEIVDRVLARRKRFHVFDTLDPSKTCCVIIDMQNLFCEPGGAAEVPATRGLVPCINDLTESLRTLGAKIVWVTHENICDRNGTDWNNYFDVFVAGEVRKRTLESLVPGNSGQDIWHELHVDEHDLRITKNRYSALIPGSSSLERVLRSYGLENVLIAGTKTNVCCESTGRDAMMMDFRVVMISDCLAALSDEEHRAALETFIQQFGDVMTAEEVLAALGKSQ